MRIYFSVRIFVPSLSIVAISEVKALFRSVKEFPPIFFLGRHESSPPEARFVLIRICLCLSKMIPIHKHLIRVQFLIVETNRGFFGRGL